MTYNELKSLLEESKYKIESESDVEHGKRIKLTNGATITSFNKGTLLVQGKTAIKSEIETFLKLDNRSANIARESYSGYSKSNEVFVVYGHDNEARNQLEAMLRRWGLEPLILDQLPSEGQTIIEKLEKYTKNACFGIVLATPDDQGHQRDKPDEIAYRARQNVVLELGMLLSKLGRKNVAILQKSQSGMERPSDIQGLIYIPFKEDVKEAALTLAKEMSSSGYKIDIERI